MRRLAVFAVVLLLGCDKSPLEQSSDELREARALWQEQGITSYQFELRYGCFCPPEVVRPVTITVINGVMTSMVYADSGTAAPPGLHSGRQTFEQIFAQVDTTISQKPVSLTVQYDPMRGFPATIVVDHSRQMADDEWQLRVSAFQYLLP